MDKANQALSYLASGQIRKTPTLILHLNKAIRNEIIRNQSIIGIIFLVFFGMIVF